METKVRFVSPTLSAAAWVGSAGRIDVFRFEEIGFQSENNAPTGHHFKTEKNRAFDGAGFYFQRIKLSPAQPNSSFGLKNRASSIAAFSSVSEAWQTFFIISVP